MPAAFDEPVDVQPPTEKGKCTVAIGGIGGAGKSVFAVNLAIYFAQLGKRVVLADADPAGSNLPAHFGLEMGARVLSRQSWGEETLSSLLVSTKVPGLELLSEVYDASGSLFSSRASHRGRWLSALKALPADYLVIDMGAGYGHFAVDTMQAADVPIVVTIPEPPAIEAAYCFLRASYRRRLQRLVVKDPFRMGLLERAFKRLGVLPAPIELVRALEQMDPHLAELAWNETQRLRLHLLINQTRTRPDLGLGTAMAYLVRRHYGVQLEELGHVEHDDAVWLSVRKAKPLLLESPHCKAARNIERVARRIYTLRTRRNENLLVMESHPQPPTLYTVLDVTPSCSEDEIRRAYRHQQEIYATGGIATWSLFNHETRQSAQAQLDEAHNTLLDPVRRQAYDLSVFPSTPPEPEPTRTPPPLITAEQRMLQTELVQLIGPETEFSGDLLRKIRESRGIELTEISNRTKITKAHLVALEEEQFDRLPALVYVRGFVHELARQLQLDPLQVQKTYLRRIKEKGFIPRGVV